MQIKKRDGQTYLAELTDDERQALLWAVEAGHALLIDDPNISVLRREESIRTDFLDQLADDLFLVGSRPDVPSDGIQSGTPARHDNGRS